MPTRRSAARLGPSAIPNGPGTVLRKGDRRMNVTLDGRVALVTGGSSGIGKAAALALGEAGASVSVNGLSHMADAEQVAHEIGKGGRKALAVRADVSRTDEVERLVSTTVKEFGHVDILFNNAGMIQLASLEETTD